MQYGYFDDAHREYVITRPDTPYPWINYLGSEDFFSLVSCTSGGYSFYKDARLLRLTRYRYNNVPTDAGGHYFYINDEGTVWNPGWQPTQTPLDSYECRVGTGYTVIEGKKNGLKAKQTIMVPRGKTAEVTRVELTNESGETKRVSLYSFVEFCLWNAQDDSTNFQRNFALAEFELEKDGAVQYHKTEYRERRNHYAVYAVNAPVDGFDTDRESFLGLYNGFGRPDAVLEDKPRNSVAHGWAPIGSHCIKRELKPGESASFIFVLGYCENPDDQKFVAHEVINKEPAHKLLNDFQTDAQFEAALAELKAHWDKLLGKFSIQSGNEKFDRQVNMWNQYQCMVTFNMSRSASYFESGIGRGMGFRDCSQDLLGFVHLIPERARQRILDIASTQFPDGSAYHQYQPLTKRGNMDVGSGFNDDPLWLIFGVNAYIKETGDFGILDEMVDFDNDPSQAQTLLEHLRRSFRYIANHKGPHGLPLIGRADWNDCLNLNCFSEHPGESFQTTGPSEGPVAESVFIGGMYVKYGRAYARILRMLAQKAAGHVRDGGHRPEQRHGSEGHGRHGKIPAVQVRRGDPVARLQQVSFGAGRSEQLSPGLQGKRLRVLPQQPLDHDRPDQAGPRRQGVRPVHPHRPRLGGGSEAAPHRALRVRPDRQRQGSAPARRSPQQLAHRHRRLEFRGRQPGYFGRQARF